MFKDEKRINVWESTHYCGAFVYPCIVWSSSPTISNSASRRAFRN